MNRHSELDRVVAEMARGWRMAPDEPGFGDWIGCSVVVCEALEKCRPITSAEYQLFAERLGQPAYFFELCTEAIDVGLGSKPSTFFIHDDACCRECGAIAAALRLQQEATAQQRLLQLGERWLSTWTRCGRRAAFAEKLVWAKTALFKRQAEERHQVETARHAERERLRREQASRAILKRQKAYKSAIPKGRRRSKEVSEIERLVAAAAKADCSSVTVSLSGCEIEVPIMPRGNLAANLLRVAKFLKGRRRSEADNAIVANLLVRLRGDGD